MTYSIHVSRTERYMKDLLIRFLSGVYGASLGDACLLLSSRQFFWGLCNESIKLSLFLGLENQRSSPYIARTVRPVGVWRHDRTMAQTQII